jgi:hypothetical protein
MYLSKNFNNIKYKCPNHIICNNIIEDVSQDGICTDCYLLFGKWRNKEGILKTKNEKDLCPLCSEIETIICRPACEHHLCVHCFKLLYFGMSFSKPEFPYSDKEYIYWLNIENEIEEEWMKDIQIKEYLTKLKYWERMSNIYIPCSSKCFECYSEEA